MKKMTRQWALALAVLSLAGCGLKGPLYFPDKTRQPQATQPASPTQSGSNTSAAAASTGQDVQPVQ